MSTWTDVLGAMCFFSDNDLVDKFEEITRNAPTGSEGGLTFSLNIEGNYGTLTVSGSLRDYDRPTEILNWWKSLHTDWGIRESMIMAHVSNMTNPYVMLMNDDDEVETFDINAESPKYNFKMKEFY